MILAITFIALAAVCKALADTLDHHFDTSIFRGKPRRTWDPNVVQKTNRQIFGYPLDAWHIANSVQICCWLLLPLVYQPTGIDLGKQWLTGVADVCISGTWFIVVFNVFYNKIFR